MASKREGSKETIESTTGYVFEKVYMSFLIYEDTTLFIDKEINIKWKDVNDIFLGIFEDNLEDAESMSTYIGLACTRLHTSTPHFHAWT